MPVTADFTKFCLACKHHTTRDVYTLEKGKELAHDCKLIGITFWYFDGWDDIAHRYVSETDCPLHLEYIISKET